MKQIKKWFTLIEIIIVVVMIWIMLSWVVVLGRWYLKTMEVKTEKQAFMAQYNELATIARTSNYVDGFRYESVDISITQWWILWEATLEWGWTYEIIDFDFNNAELVFTWSDTAWRIDITILPYAIGCNQVIVTSTASLVSSVDLQLVSSINSDEYCFEVDERTCKLSQNRCN